VLPGGSLWGEPRSEAENMAAPWSRVVNATIKNYIRDREVNILRNRKLTALLKKRGRISFNWSGTSMVWRVKYKRVKLSPFADGDTLTFERKERYKTAELDWRGYSATDSMTKGEYLQNRGKEAIIKLYSSISTDLMDDCEDAFGEEFFIDGTLAANSKRLHGIETFLGATASSGNGAATPNVTNYAGLSCVPGAYGGSWDSGTLPGWPHGKGDAHYDFWSPLVVDYTDGLFKSGGASWANECVDALAFAIIKSKKSKSARGMLDVFFMDDEMYRALIGSVRDKEQINVNRGQASGLVSLGFTDVINIDGVDVTWEYGMPPGVGYGYNVDMMELRSQQGQIFVPEGPDFDIATKSWRFSIDFFGNLVFNPKFQVKLVAL
jgi:hypothetical protein